MSGEVRGSLKAENRIKRRFARFKQRQDLRTRDPLLAELMLAQIDATLSVSHAIQELSIQLGIAGLEVMRQQPPPFGSKSRATEIAIGTLRAEVRGLQGQIDGLERHISALASATVEAKDNSFPPDGNLPWWAFWRGW